MATRSDLSRREAIRIGVAVAATGVLAACAPEPPASKPEPKPSATSTPATAATPAVSGTAINTAAAKPTESARPTTEPVGTSARLGRNLIGKLEGPEIVTDPARFPTSFKEAPQLAELVKAGKLPPVAERIGQDPLIIKPVREIGKYGGTWRRGFTGPADKFNGYRTVGIDNLLHWDFTGTKIVPNIARGSEFADGGRSFILHLRRGMKWSDGQPFTADDFVFWFEDVYQNKDIVPTPAVAMMVNFKPVVIEKVDTYTVAFRAPEPYYVLPALLAGNTAIAGHAQGGPDALGSYAPAHYMKRFHPKYTPQAELDQAVKTAGFDNWVNLFKSKNDWALNPELPVVTAWKTITPINTPVWTLERNPYSIWVDTEGNQLPYIDKVQMTLAENLEVLNLRVVAGEYDAQDRHVDAGKLPVLLENRDNRGYRVYLDPGTRGTEAALQINQSYDGDAEIAKWLTNRDFRVALSLGIDRGQLHESFWLGLGTPGSPVVAESSPYNPGPEYRTLNHTYDPTRANQLLDANGLNKKDDEGYRLRTDDKGRLRLQVTALSGLFLPYPQIAEMIGQQWKRIGIQADVMAVERSLKTRRLQANELQIDVDDAGGSEDMFAHNPNTIFPVDAGAYMGTLYGQWFASGGTKGKEPPPRMREVMEKYKKAFTVPEDERNQLAKAIWQIVVEEVWTIGTVGQSPAGFGVRVVKTALGNIPERAVNGAAYKSPSPAGATQFYFR